MSDPPKPSSNLDGRCQFRNVVLALHLSCFILRSFSPYSLCAFTATAAFAAIAIECGVAEMDVLCGETAEAAAEGRESVRASEADKKCFAAADGRASCDLRFPRFIFKLSSLQLEFFRIVRSLTWNNLLVRCSIDN